MALKVYTMSFKEGNKEEVELHRILSQKTSPMAFAKDVLIEVLVRGKGINANTLSTKDDIEIDEDKDSISELYGLD